MHNVYNHYLASILFASVFQNMKWMKSKGMLFKIVTSIMAIPFNGDVYHGNGNVE